MNKRLGKLEIKETKKIMFIIGTVIIVYMILAVICAAVSNNASTDAPMIVKAILGLCSVMVFLCAALYMVKRYYDLLFSNEAQMRFSFPVDNTAHLNTNIKYGLMWMFILIGIMIAGIGISDCVTESRTDRLGVINLWGDYVDSFTWNHLENADAKAFICVLALVLALIALVINCYISFIFTLTISKAICTKYNLMQKNGIILIVGIVMFNIHILVGKLFERIEMIIDSYLNTLEAWDKFGPDEIFIENINMPVIFILFYGITAVIMYLVCRKMIASKIDI